jgi:peptide deformylase
VEVLTLGDETLRQKALPVKPIDAAWKKIAAGMIDTLHENKGIGLAGPQVGILRRIFVVHVEKTDPLVFINPSFLETSAETCKYDEGCLSIPELYADVIRPERVKVQAWNERGRPFTLEADGILARVIQHENDHLEGLLFIDRLSEARRERILAKYEKAKRGKAR